MSEVNKELDFYKLKEKIRIRKKLYYEKNKERIRAKINAYNKLNFEKIRLLKKKCEIRRRYGIVYEDYLSMHNEQKYKCKICDRHASNFKRGLMVDHDHKTGKVRSLLCPKCNALLHVLEDKEMYDKCVKYLNSHKED